MTPSPSGPSRSRRSASTRPSSAGASSTRSSRPAGVRRLLLAAALLCAAASVSAHELGSIRVSAHFQKDGTYRIDATVDREHLPPGFGDGRRIDPRLLPIAHLTPEREARVAGIVAAAIDGVEIAFDGTPVRPAVELVPPEGGV